LKVHLNTVDKTRQIPHPGSREYLNLKMMKFGEGFFIGVIARDVSFPTSPTPLNLELYNSRYR
jgi:hypothetical protein